MSPLTSTSETQKVCYVVLLSDEKWIILSNFPHYLILYHINFDEKEVSVILLRKNITINDEHLKMLEPVLVKHNNNLSAAIRDIIEYADFTLKKYGDFEKGKEILDKGAREEESVYDITIPVSLFKWLLTSREGKMPSVEEVRQLFISQMFTEQEIYNLIRSINEQNKSMNWPLFIKCHVDKSKLFIIITGVDQTINKFEAVLLSQYLATLKEPYVLKDLLILPTSIQMQYEKGTKEIAEKELSKHFDVSQKL